LTSKPREKTTAEEIKAAREQQQAQGSDSLFDTPAYKEEIEVKEKPKKESFAKKKKKHTEVCTSTHTLQDCVT
jgi:hypothetical protein